LIIAAITACILLWVGGSWAWYAIRPQPKSSQERLFEGVTYIRDVRSSPRPMVIHVVKIDLKADGISVLVTPGDKEAELPLKARTTSQFLDDFDLQVAINGDGFEPWHSRTILDYYPHSGDRVDVIGLAASKGVIYSESLKDQPTLYLSRANQARFNAPYNKTFNAISGNLMLVKNGQPLKFSENSPNPRTAVALDRASRHLIMVVVDGRQTGYSEGATLAELAEIIIYHGGYNAMNLDGGGSSTLAVESMIGRPDVLNTPIDNNIKGRERPVGNHLGIFAKPLNE
jgi:hypothetical protein